MTLLMTQVLFVLPIFAKTYEGFEIDRVLHVGGNTSDLHYHLYVPPSYDGSEPYALYVALPGYGAYYFQGVAKNLRIEKFAVEAKKYNPHMIIAAPQPDDWGENSKRQVIALTEYLLHEYRIDRNRVYISGYSGGGETLSLAVSERPELFARAMHISSKWDFPNGGDFSKAAQAGTAIYFVIGEGDEYYSSRPARNAYEHFCAALKKLGVSSEEINRRAILDVKPASYFETRGMKNQHGGGSLFAFDEEVMGWLFGGNK